MFFSEVPFFQTSVLRVLHVPPVPQQLLPSFVAGVEVERLNNTQNTCRSEGEVERERGRERRRREKERWRGRAAPSRSHSFKNASTRDGASQCFNSTFKLHSSKVVINKYLPTCTHTHTHTHTLTPIHTHTDTHAHTHTHTHTYTHTRTRISTRTQTQQQNTHTQKLTYTHKHTLSLSLSLSEKESNVMSHAFFKPVSCSVTKVCEMVLWCVEIQLWLSRVNSPEQTPLCVGEQESESLCVTTHAQCHGWLHHQAYITSCHCVTPGWRGVTKCHLEVLDVAERDVSIV